MAYHNLALCYSVLGDVQKADSVQKLFQVKFPSSKLLSKKEAASSTPSISGADITYDTIYEYFTKGEYEKALALKEEAIAKYGKDIWAPQFLFMEATLLMKNKEDSAAIQKLNKIIANYKESSIAKKACQKRGRPIILNILLWKCQNLFVSFGASFFGAWVALASFCS
jgi:tetratricopeptide (TPR) repeat protein